MDGFIKIYYYRYQLSEETRAIGGKKQHLFGIELLKQGLKKELDMEYSPKIIEKGKYGKPFLKNDAGFFNISHCNGMVACAISNVPVGIDVECSRKFQINVLKKVCNEAEQEYILKQDETNRFLQLWTLKESYIKMLGEGLRFPLKEVNFMITPWTDKEAEDWKDPEEIQCNQKGYFYQKMTEKYLMSVCVESRMGRPCLYEAVELEK